jgi:hypothetical protein
MMRSYTPGGEAGTTNNQPARPFAFNILARCPDAPSKGVRYTPLQAAGLVAIIGTGFTAGSLTMDAIVGFARALRD